MYALMLTDKSVEDRIELPINPSTIDAVLSYFALGKGKINRMGLYYGDIIIAFEQNELSNPNLKKILSSCFRGRLYLEFDAMPGLREDILSFIYDKNIDFKKGTIESISFEGSEAERREIRSSGFVRNAQLSDFLKEFYGYQCMICKEFILTEGLPYTESHHMIPLSENGPDTPDNIAIVCPNCHCKAHFGTPQDKGRILQEFTAKNPFIKKPTPHRAPFSIVIPANHLQGVTR